LSEERGFGKATCKPDSKNTANTSAIHGNWLTIIPSTTTPKAKAMLNH